MDILKIGITLGDKYKTALDVFENPTMQELAQPILYGNKDTLLQERKAMEATTNFTNIQSPLEAQKEKLSLINCDSIETERECALKHYQDEMLDAVVLCNDSRTALSCPPDATELMVTEDDIIALVDEISEKTIGTFASILERDYDRQQPRIAVITTENTLLGTEINQESLHPCLYGPYDINVFFEQERHFYFDGVICADKESMIKKLESREQLEYTIRHFASKDKIIISPWKEGFCQAIYLANDIHRNRMTFDEARRNPLEKLFHEKREDRRASKENKEAENNVE